MLLQQKKPNRKGPGVAMKAETELVEIDLECYGTIGTKQTAREAALKAGKTPAEAETVATAKFTAIVPDIGADVSVVVASFIECYGFEDDAKPRANGDRWTAEDKFWLKCQKHLQDKLRADHKRPPAKVLTPEQQAFQKKMSLLSPEKKAELMSLMAAFA